MVHKSVKQKLLLSEESDVNYTQPQITKGYILLIEPAQIHVLENNENGRWETLYPNVKRCQALRDLEQDVPKALAEDDYIVSVIRHVNQIIGKCEYHIFHSHKCSKHPRAGQ